MPSLREVQRAFAAALRDEAAVAIERHVVGGALGAAARLRVYRNNHELSLGAALADVYPVVRALVGAGFFAWLAHEFIARHPSRSGNLHGFGVELAAFLRGFEAAASLPYLPEVAALEWAWHEAFHGPGHAPLDLASLARVPPAQHAALRFTLHPSATLLRGQTPFVSIWHAHQPDPARPTPVAPGLPAEQALVLRPALEVRVLQLQAGEAALLAALAAGETLGSACEQALHCQADTDLGACLQRHVALGSLVSWRATPDPATAPRRTAP